MKSGEILPLDVTLTLVQQHCRATFIDAHLYQVDEGWRYEIKLHSDANQLLYLTLDASDGQLLSPCKA